METVLNKVVSLKTDPNRLELNRRWLHDHFSNYYKNQPHEHVSHFLHQCLVSPYWGIEEKIAALAEVTVEVRIIQFCNLLSSHQDMNHFIPLLFSRMFLNIFYHGNIVEEEGLKLAETVQGIVKPKALSKDEIPFKRVVQLNQGVAYTLSIAEPNPDNENSAITQWYQV